ncbi:MAG: serine/threonine-protein kinase, partial [Planctomycetota bacterium]
MRFAKPLTNAASAESSVGYEVLLDEMAEVVRDSDPQQLDDFLNAHPEQCDKLREMLPTVRAMAQVADGATTSVARERSTAEHGGFTVPGQLGDFQIVREIGRGGMGVVYEAEQLSLERRVALKILPFAAVLDPRQLERFKIEARAAATLDHPAAVSIYAVGCERGVHYLAMQWIEGQSLGEAIAAMREEREIAVPKATVEKSSAAETPNAATNDASQRPMRGQTVDARADETRPGHSRICSSHVLSGTGGEHLGSAYFRNIARLGVQAARALDHAHDRGIVHRDVKPSNLLLDTAGDVHVADFGLAMIEAEPGVSMTGDVVGTLRYMSPEQALGQRKIVDHRADVYSLGATLYEALALQPPFASDDRRELLRVIADSAPAPLEKLVAKIPADLTTIVGKAMEKEPGDRYQTAADL